MRPRLTNNAMIGLGLALAAVTLSACVSRPGAYSRLQREFHQAPMSAYYQAEAAPAVTAGDQPEPATDAFVDEVRAKVLKLRQDWETALARDVAATTDVDDAELAALRQLAKSGDADKQLAKATQLPLLLGVALERSPKLKAARESVRATLQQYPQAVYLDDILRQYNAFTKQLNTKTASKRHKEMLAMKFPFPGALTLKGRIVSEDVRIAEQQRQIARRDLMADIKAAHHDFVFVTQAIAINEKSKDLLRQMLKVAQTKVRVDKAKYGSVIMAQVELSKLSDAIITLEERRETMIARINALLGRPADAALGPPATAAEVDLAATLSQVYDLALERRQELVQHRLRIHKMKLMVELATRMKNPDASLGASYFEDRMKLSNGAETGSPPFMPNRRLDPAKSASFGQRDAYVREVEVRLGAMQQMLAQQENMTRFEVKKRHFGLDAAKRSISLYRYTLLPQARQAMEVANTGYQAGRTDFLTFLDTQRTLLKFQLEEQRALRDHRTHLARLEQLSGRALPKKPLALATGATPKKK